MIEICGVKFNEIRNATPNKNVCNGCPCTITDESEMISNYGCLPHASDLIKMYLDGEGVWKCHSKNQSCGGLLHTLKENGIEFNRNNNLLITEDNPWIKKE